MVPFRWNFRRMLILGAFEFGTPNYVMQPMNNPAYQWEVSVDDGYTWTDIPRQNSINLSYSFHLLDTFWVRVRVAEAGQIANRSRHIFSNVLQIQVDGPPADFDLKTNSPVCTDGDLLLEVSGGATYNTFLVPMDFPTTRPNRIFIIRRWPTVAGTTARFTVSAAAGGGQRICAGRGATFG